MVNTAQGTYTLRQKQLGKGDSGTWRVGQHPLASTVASIWCHFLIECSLSNPGGGHSYHSCSTDEETPKPRKVLASSIPQSLRVSAGLKGPLLLSGPHAPMLAFCGRTQHMLCG